MCIPHAQLTLWIIHLLLHRLQELSLPMWRRSLGGRAANTLAVVWSLTTSCCCTADRFPMQLSTMYTTRAAHFVNHSCAAAPLAGAVPAHVAPFPRWPRPPARTSTVSSARPSHAANQPCSGWQVWALVRGQLPDKPAAAGECSTAECGGVGGARCLPPAVCFANRLMLYASGVHSLLLCSQPAAVFFAIDVDAPC
jgi:hypothetical protein